MLLAEVAPRLFVGDEDAFHHRVAAAHGWAVVHACKDPFHRSFVNYTGRAAPKGPEYLVAERGERLALNLVDVDDPSFVAEELITSFLAWTEPRWSSGRNILIHCNQGRSRSPSLALLLLARAHAVPHKDLTTAEAAFRLLYPNYQPRAGIRGFLASRWSRLVE